MSFIMRSDTHADQKAKQNFASANAGRPSRLHFDVFGPARLHSAFAKTGSMTAFRFCCAVPVLMSSGLTCPYVGVGAPSGAAIVELPAAVAMNRGAGEGMLLFVDVQTESGETFPCVIDTGSPNTVSCASGTNPGETLGLEEVLDLGQP